MPQLLVPDNTKVAVIKACLYDPQVNRSYAEMARHYDTAMLPARPRRPRDKAKVEACVVIVERWLSRAAAPPDLLQPGRTQCGDRRMMALLNEVRPIRRLGETRRQMFEEIDAPDLKPLPAEPCVHAEWKRCRVGLDYHVELERHHYSVPYRFARREVEARFTARTVEVFLRGERIAAHMRGSRQWAAHDGPGAHAVEPPALCRMDAGEDPRGSGPDRADAVALVEKIIEGRPHPEQGFRSCLGIISLEKRFGAERLEAAALRALEIQARNYGSVKSILDNGLDKVPAPKSPDRAPIDHANIRGSRYYH